MQRPTGIAVLAAGLLFTVATAGELSAQSADTPACKLLSVAEVQKITGVASYQHAWGMGPGEAVGGGSSCAFEQAVSSLERLPMIGFSLIPGKGWTERRRTMQLPSGCKRVPVAGVGDDAFYEECPSKTPKRRIEPLYVKVGSNDIVVEMDIRPPVNDASARNATVALAKVVAAKLKK